MTVASKRRSRRPSLSYRHGKRGRHKHASSPQTRAWESDHAPPEQPAWLDADEYAALLQLRQRLELE